jgi:hypothetical protein
VLDLDAQNSTALVNGTDGSFSTNHVAQARTTAGNRVDAALVDDQDWTVGIELEQNFALDPYVEPLYGKTRITGSFAFAGRPRGGDHCGTRIIDICDARRGVRASTKFIRASKHGCACRHVAEADCFPSSEGGWGFFVRYYYGQDYYNIAFLENISRWQAGMTFSQDGFFRFHRRTDCRPAIAVRPDCDYARDVSASKQ